ncbi:glycohydrolase toxin TNT-related protein [Actinokineospora xionganensis]|uniref:Glycohydrolase toxin TNT-related protein n=1 Tax=Actinokineospora xionganensis TaxID=2684470 RepID=A0ABR7L783_9PSEU|nr:glycohydrolase toxin TNT-related protein [Actinokineospora xionganensis]MBC6448437.1 glycohydrolase toxin TNT-related protein [Actinokineospora xionganensis]
MGIQLPPELADVATAAGVTWPQADEDAMREAAQAWRDAGTQMSTLTGDADTVARTTLSAVEGETGTAAANHWTRFVAPDTGYLTGTARDCVSAADRLEHAAEQVGAAKVEIVRDLVALAKNSDAANQAAAAGNPTALLGLDTAIRGTAVNVAAITETLISAVQPSSGQDVSAVRDVVNANPGAHGASLLGGVVDGLGQTVIGTTGALVDTAVNTTSGLTQAVGHAATGLSAGVVGTAGGAVEGLAQTAHGVTGAVAGVANTAVGGVNQTVGGVTGAVAGVADTAVGGVNQTVGGVTEAVGGVTGAVAGATHGVSEAALGMAPGLMQAADGATSAVAETADPANVVDFYGDANAGTGPIRLPMDAIADAPTPPTGFPAVANDSVQAASAAVLDAPAPSAGAQPQSGQPAAPGVGGVPGGGGLAGAAPAGPGAVAGGLAGGPVGGGVLGGGAVGGAPAAGGGRQPQPGPGRESTAVPVPDQRGKPGGGPGMPVRSEGSGRQAEEAAGSAAMLGFAPNQYSGGQSAGRPPIDGAPGAQQANRQQPGDHQDTQSRQPHAGAADTQSRSGSGQPGGAQDIQSRLGAGHPGAPDSPSRQGAGPAQQPGVSRPAGFAVAAVDVPAPDQHDQEPPVSTGSLALFLVHMFPIGHLPKATSHPARQLPAPPAELDYAAGLRFEADDHPESRLIDLTTRQPAAPSDGAPAPAELTEGYDPLGGEHERDWDRRFLVRDAHPVEYAWPPGELYPEGGSAEGEPEVLAEGTELDRFGTPEGRVFSAAATRFGARSLPPAHLEAGYRRYRVLRPIPVWRSVSAPWFGQSGGGERYRATQSAADLLALGYLADTTHGDQQ